MKAYWGVEVQLNEFLVSALNVGQLHAPAALPPGKELLVPLDRRLGGPQSRYGRGGEEKNSQPLPGIEPPIIQPVAQRYTAMLSRISARGYGEEVKTKNFCRLWRTATV
jgi:hypothetical protein